MKYVVTGATGLVGGHLTRAILTIKEEGDKVLALGRNEKILNNLVSLGASTEKLDITADLSEFNLLDDWGGESSIWYHCAAAVTGDSDANFQKINIDGTEKLIKKAEELKINKFVLISSIAIYGLHSDNPDGFQEDNSPNPANSYGASKLNQEELLKSSKLNWLIFRPPFIGGPEDKNVLLEFSVRIKSGKMPRISKEGYLGYVDARDLGYIVFKGSKSDFVNQAYNVQNNSHSLGEFVNTLGENLGLEPPYGKKYPYRVLMIIGHMNDLFAKLRGKSAARSISAYRIRGLTSRRFLDTTKIITDLDFKPKYNLDQSITDWLKTKNE
ncbi:MAG: ADP-L-glycero-D-manno-heptose-6-epimerase [Candidatus Heimdallarchaeota archaeon LC_2]|nr:MAG: ADP-L-glycero-D-manno-heptose-6-epimerase [Candidatus Heimdallarchaeota archaeon LC_2]